MCKNVEQILDQAPEMPFKCEVNMEGEGHVSDDFVAVLADENGDHTLLFHTDFVTLSIAAKLIHEAMDRMLAEMSEEDIEALIGEDMYE